MVDIDIVSYSPLKGWELPAASILPLDSDAITVTAYKCVYCEGVFPELDLALSHVDKCPAAHATYYKKTGVYLETDFGNMVLKEAVV